jgi:uncharacterized membrane protein YbhN (UPF0104 family)
VERTSSASLVKRLRSRKPRVLLGAALILVSLALLAYFIYKNWGALTAYPWQLSYPHFVLTLVLHLCAFIIAIAAWHSIISRLAGATDLRLNARIYCYSAVARRLPGMLWDVATRVVMYDQVGISKAAAGVASLLEFVLITLAGIVLYIALTPFTLSYAQLGSWSLFGTLGVGLVLTHPHLVKGVVRKIKKDSVPLPLRYRDNIGWLVIYTASWAIGGLILWATIGGIYDLSSDFALQVIADWTLAGVVTSIVTFVPAGLGLREVTLTLLLSRYMPEHIAVSSAVLMRLLMTSYSILWLLVSERL